MWLNFHFRFDALMSVYNKQATNFIYLYYRLDIEFFCCEINKELNDARSEPVSNNKTPVILCRKPAVFRLSNTPFLSSES